MPHYHFTIYDDQSAPDNVGAMALPDDDSAWEFGEAMIRGLLAGDAGKYETWTMEITEGNRIVASIAFNLKDLRDRRTLQ
jgi:hypothetical protein